MDNEEYDKVLVKLDGSGRLTTRNRRFVKKIVSQPDPVQTGASQPIVPESVDIDIIPDEGGDTVTAPLLDSGIVENNMSDDQLHDSQGGEVGGITENEVTDDIVTNVDPLLNNRP